MVAVGLPSFVMVIACVAPVVRLNASAVSAMMSLFFMMIEFLFKLVAQASLPVSSVNLHRQGRLCHHKNFSYFKKRITRECRRPCSSRQAFSLPSWEVGATA